MVEKYDSVRIGNKRKRASPKSKKTVTVEYAESTFETKGCKHSFHLDCANNILLNQPSDTYFECPVCKAIQGVKMGNQPESGEMKITKENFDLPGYTRGWTLKKDDTGQSGYTKKFESCKGTMVVEYKFTNGTQTSNHPSPGNPYYAHMFPRKAYFPATPEGIKIVGMLRVAFDRKLVFTVGRSATTGRENVITWNGIHHKTKIADSAYGYPDPTYLQRIGDELKALGITPSDLQSTGSIIKQVNQPVPTSTPSNIPVPNQMQVPPGAGPLNTVAPIIQSTSQVSLSGSNASVQHPATPVGAVPVSMNISQSNSNQPGTPLNPPAGTPIGGKITPSTTPTPPTTPGPSPGTPGFPSQPPSATTPTEAVTGQSGTTATPSSNQRNQLAKWESDELLGDQATIAMILYANQNYPNLKSEYPIWIDRIKQIASIWKSLPNEKRQPYVQQARENRTASSIIH